MDIFKIIKNRTENKKNLLFLIGLGVMLIACFLPIYKISFFGIMVKQNYIYVNSKFADGIYIVIGVIITFILWLFKKDKFTLMPLFIIAIILINLLIETNDKDLIRYTTIWFWFIYIGFITALVSIILFILDENSNKLSSNPRVCEAEYEEIDNKFGFCPHCGYPKVSRNSTFCLKCGEKY